jgi:hypothetical protein
LVILNKFYVSLVRNNWWLLGPLLAVVVFLPSLFIYFSGEDFIFINFVAKGHSFYEPSQNLFYRPLANLVWQFDYNLWGLHATGYHVTNLLLHLANIGMVALLIRHISGNKSLAALSAILFALQPIHVEAVVWLAARPDLLATFFFLLALLLGLKQLEKNTTSYYYSDFRLEPLVTLNSSSNLPKFKRQRESSDYLAFSVLVFAIGIFCKESVVGLPVVLFGLFFLLKRPVTLRNWLNLIFFILPYLLVATLYLGVRLTLLGGMGGYASDSQVLILNMLWNISLGAWLPLLFPINIASAGWVISSVLVGGLALFYVWLLLKLWQTRFFTNKNLLMLLQILFIMYGSLLPVLNISPIKADLAQSRILYLPSVGFCFGLATAIYWVLTKATWFNPLKKESASKVSNISNKKFLASPLWLSLFYLASLGLALIPWWLAGGIVADTFRLLQISSLAVQAGDTVYYKNLPDSWRGAYIWRNGLAEATQLFLNPNTTGLLRTDNLLIDYRRAAQGNLWFLDYALAADNSKLSSVSGYRVSNSIDQILIVGQVSWNLKNCEQQGWSWESTQGTLKCTPKQGLLFDTAGQKTGLLINSPTLTVCTKTFNFNLTAYADYDFQQPQTSGEIALLANNNAYYQQPFDLANDGKNHMYSFWLPAGESCQPLRIQLKFNKFRSNILWSNFSWGSPVP